MNMKLDNRGFTLVELLAVIVILAIVALVTTPAILNVINNSRRSGAEDKAWGTIDAVRLAYVQSQSLDNEGVIDKATYSVGFSSSDTTADEIKKVGQRNVTVSGEMPSAGIVRINTETGNIIAVGLTYTKGGKYVCTSNTEGTDMCCKSGSSAPTGTDKANCGRDDFNGSLAS